MGALVTTPGQHLNTLSMHCASSATQKRICTVSTTKVKDFRSTFHPLRSLAKSALTFVQTPHHRSQQTSYKLTFTYNKQS